MAVSHGGVEMGQGLNTKVAQVVAKTLGITMDMIKVKPTDNLMAPNNSCTGGSVGSEICSSVWQIALSRNRLFIKFFVLFQAANFAAKNLKERMDKVKVAMTEKSPTWFDLVTACSRAGLDLTSRYM